MTETILALTVLGQALQAKIELGNGMIPLLITRIVSGAGTSPTPTLLTDVVEKKQTFSITGRDTVGPQTVIKANLTNQGNPAAGEPPLADEYELYQIGMYAHDPDLGEILYRITQIENPLHVPPALLRSWLFAPSFEIKTENASEVIINITAGGIATLENVWSSTEYSAAVSPQMGVKVHHRIMAAAPDYRAADLNTPSGSGSILPGSIQLNNAAIHSGKVDDDFAGLQDMSILK